MYKQTLVPGPKQMKRRRRNYPLDPCLGSYSPSCSYTPQCQSKGYGPDSPIFAFTCPSPPPSPSPQQRSEGHISNITRATGSTHLTVEAFLKRSKIKPKARRRQRPRLSKADSRDDEFSGPLCLPKGKKRSRTIIRLRPASVASFPANQASETSFNCLPDMNTRIFPSNPLNLVHVNNLELPWLASRGTSATRTKLQPNSLYGPCSSTKKVRTPKFGRILGSCRRIRFYASPSKEAATPLDFVSWDDHESGLQTLYRMRTSTDEPKPSGMGSPQAYITSSQIQVSEASAKEHLWRPFISSDPSNCSPVSNYQNTLLPTLGETIQTSPRSCISRQLLSQNLRSSLYEFSSDTSESPKFETPKHPKTQFAISNRETCTHLRQCHLEACSPNPLMLPRVVFQSKIAQHHSKDITKFMSGPKHGSLQLPANASVSLAPVQTDEILNSPLNESPQYFKDDSYRLQDSPIVSASPDNVLAFNSPSQLSLYSNISNISNC